MKRDSRTREERRRDRADFSAWVSFGCFLGCLLWCWPTCWAWSDAQTPWPDGRITALPPVPHVRR